MAQEGEIGWAQPQRVSVAGYDGDIMEPFITRDGRWLLFNNRNEAPANTNLHWAERIDDLHFRYRGEMNGVNTPALEGVASLDRDGNLYFVSTRSYDQSLSVIYHARWTEGMVSAIDLVPGISDHKRGRVQFDVEVSADGNTLYAVDGKFGFFGLKGASLFIARKHDGTWTPDPRSGELLREVNLPGHLTYAAGISSDELSLYFTQVAVPFTKTSHPSIWVARRGDIHAPFGRARRILAIDGFVEGPTVAPGDLAIYYHKREGDRFVLYRCARPPSG